MIARPAAENFTETVELEWGVDSLEAMGFVMRTMLEQVVERLQLRGMAAGEIALALELDGRRRDLRRIALPAPTNEVRTLLALIGLNLEAAPPAAAVEAIRITVEPRAPRAAQADLFAPPCPAPERLHVTLARLAALCGPGKVGTLMPRDSHLPGAVELGPFAPRPTVAPARAHNGATVAANRGAAKGPVAADATVTQLALRAVRPPHQIEVLCTRGGALEFVRGANFGGRVVSCAGPWRIAAAENHIDNGDASAQSARRGARLLRRRAGGWRRVPAAMRSALGRMVRRWDLRLAVNVAAGSVGEQSVARVNGPAAGSSISADRGGAPGVSVKYIELRARSAFSFLEGSALPEDLVERAAELGYPAIAMGDRDGLYGAPRFYHGAERAGIRAIVGAELTIDLSSDWSSDPSSTNAPSSRAPCDQRLYVLVPDRDRYRNLCRMITASKMRRCGRSIRPKSSKGACRSIPPRGRAVSRWTISSATARD